MIRSMCHFCQRRPNSIAERYAANWWLYLCSKTCARAWLGRWLLGKKRKHHVQASQELAKVERSLLPE